MKTTLKTKLLLIDEERHYGERLAHEYSYLIEDELIEQVLRAGISHPLYWTAYEYVLENALWEDLDGVVWRLYEKQDSLIAIEQGE